MTSKLVAVDDGYAQIKVFGDPLTEGGAPVRQVFRSSIKAGRSVISLTGGSVDAYKTEEGDDFTVGDLPSTENTQFDSYHTSPLNRVLVVHGVIAAGYAGEIDLTTGLPVADYFRADGVDADKIAAKRANLLKQVTSGDRVLPKFTNVSVGCQAVAAFFDIMFDERLEYRVGRSTDQAVAIVDIGGRTTDIAVIDNGNLDRQRSGTANNGVLDVYKALSDLISQKFNLKDDFPQSMVDTAVRTNELRIFGQNTDISDLVEAAKRDVQGKIVREVERKIGSGATLGSIVFVGGGGSLFGKISEAFPNGEIAEDPEFANARGLWKYRRIQAAESKAA